MCLDELSSVHFIVFRKTETIRLVPVFNLDEMNRLTRHLL